MWKSRRIASAQECCSRKKHCRPSVCDVNQASGRDDTATKRAGGAPVYGFNGGEYDTQSISAEEEEKAKLLTCSEAAGGDNNIRSDTFSSLYTLPSMAAMARRELTCFLIQSLKKLTPWHVQSGCDVLKRKCSISLSNPVLCFPFRSHVPEGDDEEVRYRLLNLGIQVHPGALRSHRRFSLHELCMATSHFAKENVLGKGSAGCVYRGELACSGSLVAVKVLNTKLKDARTSFAAEIEIMSQVQDCHIQALLGYCVEDGRLLLVYSYMPRGSLDGWLHGKYRPKLSWNDRRKVAVGITKALCYLHTKCKPPVIHRDVKASNILLTKGNEPKLTDFGLAVQASLSNSICKDIMGTFGYLAPEYFQYGKVSTKIDIYALGIVLLELMTGRRPIDNAVSLGEGNLANWARHLICNTHGCTKRLADPELGASYSSAGMMKLLCIAALCIHPLEGQRPSIEKVLAFMKEETMGKLHWLVSQAYRQGSSPISYYLTFSSDHCKARKQNEDLRKQYLEMAMLDVEERSSLLCSPLLVL